MHGHGYSDEEVEAMRTALRVLGEEWEPRLHRWIDGEDLPLIDAGSTAIVFALGDDKVLRVTPDGWGNECAEVEEMAWRFGGQPPGWPRVYDVLRLDDEGLYDEVDDDGYEWGQLCAVVAERVRVADQWTAAEAEDIADALYLVKRARDGFEVQVPAAARVWGEQLLEGLDARFGNNLDAVALDLHFGNVGIASDGSAVWVDFGL